VDFDDPPVIEVALAVQFEEPTIDSLDVAAFSARVKEAFPRRTEQPARPPMEESFDEVPEGAQFRFEVLERQPLPRFWFLTEDESQLIQIQQDLIALNWRKVETTPQYPRYPTLRDSLTRHLGELQDVLSAEGKSMLRPNWCEVTYINHVGPDPEGHRIPLHEVVTLVRDVSGGVLPAAEDAQVAARFRIVENESPVGRLTVTVNPAFRAPDKAPIWVLTLTARLRSAEATLDAALARLDLGREWLGRSFRELTTPRMHAEWRLRETA
jgi:uncharacterized protein (TIGR04255 family)